MTRRMASLLALVAAAGCASAVAPRYAPYRAPRASFVPEHAGIPATMTPTPASSPAPPLPKNTLSRPLATTDRTLGAARAAAAPQGRDEIARLEQEESLLYARYGRVREARRALIALVTALKQWRAAPSEKAVAAVRDAAQRYRQYEEAGPMNRLGVALAALGGLTAAGCSSVDAEIARLNEEERELYSRIETLQDRRKAVVRLIEALRQNRTEPSTRSAAALSRARESYASAPAD